MMENSNEPDGGMPDILRKRPEVHPTGLPTIAIVSFSTLSTGGIETHLLQLFRGLGSEFEFIILGAMEEPFRSLARERGAQSVRLPQAGKLDPAALLRLRREFLARHIQLVHTHDTRGGMIGRLAARAAGVKAVHTVHTPSFFLPRNPAAVGLYRLAERMLNRTASDRVIFVSRTIRRIYLDGRLVQPSKATLIPNGLEPVWFDATARKKRVDREVRFLYVGRLAREKGMENLAEAFGIVAAQIPGALLHVAGEGPGRETLAQTAQRGGWAGRLELHGRISRDAARDLMHASDVFVLPSRFESFSYTLLEAMACGLPCIATDVGGNRDLIEPERNGLLTPKENPAELAAAMVRLANDPNGRASMGQAGAEMAREYTLARMIDGTRSVYRQVLGISSDPT
jgi:glycosyltransferase involved in cell wall biosynthesis